MHQLVES